MSTAARGPSVHRIEPSRIPPLRNGDCLSRDEFEARFDATPGLKRAELIEGKVFLAPPLSINGHGTPHAEFLTLLGSYCAATPGVRVADAGSIRMDLKNMPQPDAFMFIDAALGGQSKITPDDYLDGAPELIVEISATSASYDLHDKLEVYRRNGVREYIVWRTFDEAIDYFILRDGKFVSHQPDAEGVFRSDVFPGLFVDAKSLLARDLAAALAVVQRGIATAGHTEFAERLKRAANRK